METGSQYVYCGSSDEEIIDENDFKGALESTGSCVDRRKRADSDEPKPKPQPKPQSFSTSKLECAAKGNMVLQRNPFLVHSEASIHTGAATVSNLETVSSIQPTMTPCGMAIDQNYPELRNNLSVDAIFPFLIKHGLLTMEQREELMLPVHTPTAKVDRILLWIPKCAGALEKFINALRESAEGTDHDRLADMLEQFMLSTTLVQPEGADLPSLKLSDRHKLPSDVEKDSREIHTRCADTNVISLQFSRLQEKVNVHTGDPIVCRNSDCTAILSNLSNLSEKGKKKVWMCEFCGTKNVVDTTPEEVPSKDDTTFAMTPTTMKSEATNAAPSGATASAAKGSAALLVFCIDVSGSMAVTVEVSAKFALKRHETLRKMSSDMKIDLNTQFTPRQKKNVTYVSRLECIQAAVEQQLLQLTTLNPEQRVAFVTFSDEVTVIGDGTREEIVITGSRLDDFDDLKSRADSLPMPRGIRHSSTFLRRKLQKIEEGGQTALGPALLVSIILASKVPGSKVIICTDGLANIGLGNLSDLKTHQKIARAQKFYEDLGTLAVDKGVTVSLITIKGTECRVLELGKVANTTMGEVVLVDPTAILKEFNHILSNPVIATNVECKIILHQQLYLRKKGSKKSVLHLKMGNVKADSEVSYEFGKRKADRKLEKKCPALIIGDVPHLPFQLQVDYTTPNGAHMKRVFTKVLKVTTEREVAEEGIDMAVMGSHAIRSAATLATMGMITEARASAHSSSSLMARASLKHTEDGATFARVSEVLIPLQRSLAESEAAAEASIADEELHLQPPEKKGSQTSESTAHIQSLLIHDELASELYTSKQSTSLSFHGCGSLHRQSNTPQDDECQPCASPHATVRRHTDSQVHRQSRLSASMLDPQKEETANPFSQSDSYSLKKSRPYSNICKTQ